MYDRADALPRPRSTVRRLALTSALTATLGLGTTAPAQAGGDQSRMDRTERKVLRVVNRIRASHGLRRLYRNRSLSRSADYHCGDMLRANFFAHASSNGTPFDTRVRRFARRSARIGENLAWVSGGGELGIAQRIVSMWMASPSHRAIILTPDFRSVGVARRTGTLGSVRAVVFTADFSSLR